MEKKQRVKDKVIKEIRNISFVIIIILALRSSFYEPYRIPSGSMIPTLVIGDFILVNKFSYGLKVPFSDFTFFDINFDPLYLFGRKGPERGDVVVFKFPKDTSTNYIKRVIGLPGDEVEIKDKIVYINGNAIEVNEVKGAPYLKDMDEVYQAYNFRFYESKTGGHKHIIQQDYDNYYTNFFDKVTVPKGHYFVMGDNRDFSNDSRFWGFVPEEHIKGKALFVWFSMILPTGGASLKMRPDRVGTKID